MVLLFTYLVYRIYRTIYVEFALKLSKDNEVYSINPIGKNSVLISKPRCFRKLLLNFNFNKPLALTSPKAVSSDYTLHKKSSFLLRICFRKCDQIRKELRIWSHLLKKSLFLCSDDCWQIAVILTQVSTKTKNQDKPPVKYLFRWCRG